MAGEPDKGTSIHIGGDLTGQVIIGSGNTSHWQQANREREGLSELRAAIDELRTLLVDVPDVPARLDELETALARQPVDLDAVDQVHGWFRRNLPRFASVLNRIVLGPVVAKLVAAGGDQLVAEFTRRFGA